MAWYARACSPTRRARSRRTPRPASRGSSGTTGPHREEDVVPVDVRPEHGAVAARVSGLRSRRPRLGAAGRAVGHARTCRRPMLSMSIPDRALTLTPRAQSEEASSSFPWWRGHEPLEELSSCPSAPRSRPSSPRARVDLLQICTRRARAVFPSFLRAFMPPPLVSRRPHGRSRAHADSRALHLESPGSGHSCRQGEYVSLFATRAQPGIARGRGPRSWSALRPGA